MNFAEKFLRAHRSHRLHRYQAITDGRGMGPAEIAEIAEILEPSQMAIYWGRLKARNYTKFNSKLYKI